MKRITFILFILLNATISNSYSLFDKETLKIIVIEDNEKKITALIDIIKKYEKFRNKPYKLLGQELIGYGHYNIEKLNNISESEAIQLLYKDFLYNYCLLSNITNKEYRLLLSALAYNIGINKVLNSEIYIAAKRNVDVRKFKQLYLQYCYINGKYNKQLYKRRLDEFNAVTKNYHKLIMVWNSGK